jgi:electron transport complex protein RnfE
MHTLKKIIIDGLWRNNPGLVQLLGLCPLLAVTNSLINAFALGLATLFVLVMSNISISLLRNFIPHTIRIAVFVIIIASVVTTVQILMNAYAHQLYLSLGIFLPLIVTNCVIIGRAESYASKQKVTSAALDGFMMGFGFMIVLIALGAAREILGHGTLFSGADILLGTLGQNLMIEVFHFDHAFLLALLPPGAFFALGFLIAFKNWVDAKYHKAYVSQTAEKVQRARVTG